MDRRVRLLLLLALAGGALVLLAAVPRAPPPPEPPREEWRILQKTGPESSQLLGGADAFEMDAVFDVRTAFMGEVVGIHWGPLPAGRQLELTLRTATDVRVRLEVVADANVTTLECRPGPEEARTERTGGGDVEVLTRPDACTFVLPPTTRPRTEGPTLVWDVLPAPPAPPERWRLGFTARATLPPGPPA